MALQQLRDQPRVEQPHTVRAVAVSRVRRRETIPVLRPRLPSLTELLPFLQSIDENQWYSNYGPLVGRLEAELTQQIGFGTGGGVVTTSNATAGLTVALLARGIRRGAFCLMPSWTFAATAHAVRAAGLEPYFHDVDARTWALDPDSVRCVIGCLPRCSVGAIMAVSPFGAPLDIAAWEALEHRTGIPVIIDAAAAFDTIRASRIPQVVSLHATKILGAGEGGFIATTDSALRDRARACCNFGFEGSRTAVMPALNAKMSEYHAAVALAALERWPVTRGKHLRIAGWYREGLASLAVDVELQPQYGNGWASSTTSVLVPHGQRPLIAESLWQSGIETRSWWGEGCHVQPAFSDCNCGDLHVTTLLGARVIGLPHYPDMEQQDVAAVVDALREAVNTGNVSQVARDLHQLSHMLR